MRKRPLDPTAQQLTSSSTVRYLLRERAASLTFSTRPAERLILTIVVTYFFCPPNLHKSMIW